MEKLRVLAECVRTIQGGEWSVREVLDLARAAGVEVREKTAYAMLYDLALPGRRSAGKRRHFSSREAFQREQQNASHDTTGSISGSISGGRKTLSPQGSLSPTPPISPNPSLFTLTSFGMPGAEAPSSTQMLPQNGKNVRKRASKPVDTSWVEPLTQSARSLAKRTLASLRKDERIITGRYFAFHFSNCKREAIKNKEMGVKIAAGLTTLGSNSQYGEITVEQFFSYCRQVHENIDGKPWYDPWLIKSVVEFE